MSTPGALPCEAEALERELALLYPAPADRWHFMVSPQPGLGGQTPLRLWGWGGRSQVLDFVHALVTGAYL